MTVPVSVYWGGQDWLADPSDVMQLLPLLNNVGNIVELKDYDHLDFIWGLDAAKRVYQPIIDEIMKKEKDSAIFMTNHVIDGSGNVMDENTYKYDWLYDMENNFLI